MRRMVLAQILVLAACTVGRVYRNSEYGFSAALPAGRTACQKSGLYEHDHGVGIFLDNGALDCAYEQESRPYMGVVGEYNAADYRTAEEAIAPLCQKGTAAVPPPGLVFPHLRSVACRRDIGAARVNITVLAQCCSRPGEQAEVPDINYIAWLDTTPERLEADTAELRDLLNRVEFFKPGQ